MIFKDIETLILEREQVNSKIRAFRVKEIRKTHNLIVSNPALNDRDRKRIQKNYANMEAQIHTAHLKKGTFDELLDELEGDLHGFAESLLIPTETTGD